MNILAFLPRWDLAATLWINGGAGRSAVWDIIGVFGASTLIAFLIVAAAIAIVWRDGAARALLVTGVVGTVAAAWMMSQLIGIAAFRERPFVHHSAVRQLIAKDAHEKSFPSDHATLAFALAIPVAAATRRRWVQATLLAAAAIVAVSRVFVGVHFVSDVIAGALLASIVWWGIRMALQKKYAPHGAAT